MFTLLRTSLLETWFCQVISWILQRLSSPWHQKTSVKDIPQPRLMQVMMMMTMMMMMMIMMMLMMVVMMMVMMMMMM